MYEMEVNNQVSKPSRNVDPRIIDSFWNIVEINTEKRLSAVEQIITVIQSKQAEAEENKISQDLSYSVERLIRGLSSSRKAARQGFAVLLTEILRNNECLKIDSILKLIVDHLPLTNKHQDSCNVIGRALAYGCVVRSNRLSSDPSSILELINSLKSLSMQKFYIQQLVCHLLDDLLTQLDSSLFKENVWPSLQEEFKIGWEACTPEKLWLLLHCHKKFPDIVKSKFLSKHWGNDCIITPETYCFIGAIIKKSTSVHPLIHPVCMELLTEVLETNQFKQFWETVVEGMLLEPHQFETTYLVFELSKIMLPKLTKAKHVHIILSSKFCNVFIRAAMSKFHPLYSAATQLCVFLVEFGRNSDDASVQTVILKSFISPPGTILFDNLTKKKSVGQLVSKLKPEAVVAYSSILKDTFLNKDESINNSLESDFDSKRCHAVKQMAVLSGLEALDDTLKVELLQCLLLHSFFSITQTSNSIPLCSEQLTPLSRSVRVACQQAFTKGLEAFQRPHCSGIGAKVRIEHQLKVMLPLVEFGNILLNSPDIISPLVDVNEIKPVWDEMITMVKKLEKWSKKDGKEDESNIFQILFLYLGLQLFTDPTSVQEKINELHECCKQALKRHHHSIKEPEEETGDEPLWVDVVVDLLLSLLSEGAALTRIIVLSVFSLLSPFITRQSLQQIMDVLHSDSGDGPLFLDDESEDDVHFESGSSSDDNESGNTEPEVDIQLKSKIRTALGSAADVSDAESETYMTDSQMMKLDDAIAEAFRMRVKKTGKNISKEDETLLHFRLRCLDLIARHLKSEPPLAHILQMIIPLVATTEFGLQNQHQRLLANKTLHTLKLLMQARKFSNFDDVEKTTFEEIMTDLISRAKKASEPSLENTLGSLCLYVVLCSKKWFKANSLNTCNKNEKKAENSWYIAVYNQLLKDYFQESSHNVRVHMFEQIMMACPETSWELLQVNLNYAFDSNTRLYKRTYALSMMVVALKQATAVPEESSTAWLETCSNILPKVVLALKEMDIKELKPLYTSNLLTVLLLIADIGKNKFREEPLQQFPELLESLKQIPLAQLNPKQKKVLRRLIVITGGVNEQEKPKKGKGKKHKIPVGEENEEAKSKKDEGKKYKMGVENEETKREEHTMFS